MTAFCQHIVSARWFQPVIIGVILSAGLLVGLETYPDLNQRYGAWFKGLDLLIVAVFVVEIALKMGAHGRQPWRFFHDPWNVFDFIIVAVCLLPLDGHYLAVLRLVRILRVLRLVTALPRLQLLVGALLKSIPSMGYVGMLLFLLFYIYAVMGTFLFGANDPMHFGSLQSALLSLFRIVTLEDWTDIMYVQMYGSAHYAIEGFAGAAQSRATPVTAVIYFVSFVLLGTMVILNLFIGVIMNGMNETQREAEVRERMKHLERLGQVTLGDEIRLIEHELDALKTRLQSLRLKAECKSNGEPPFTQNSAGRHPPAERQRTTATGQP
jgi:voltage-gated sodium channel